MKTNFDRSEDKVLIIQNCFLAVTSFQFYLIVSLKIHFVLLQTCDTQIYSENFTRILLQNPPRVNKNVQQLRFRWSNSRTWSGSCAGTQSPGGKIRARGSARTSKQEHCAVWEMDLKTGKSINGSQWVLPKYRSESRDAPESQTKILCKQKLLLYLRARRLSSQSRVKSSFWKVLYMKM